MYIKLIIIGVILSAAAGGYLYVKRLESDLQTARANVAKMEIAVQTSEASLKLITEEATRISELNMQLGEDLRKAEEYGDELRATLQKHDLTYLATVKPGLIEKRMQDATNKLWDDLESITDPSGMQSIPDSGTGNSNSN